MKTPVTKAYWRHVPQAGRAAAAFHGRFERLTTGAPGFAGGSLHENGQLTLASVGPEGLTIRSRCTVTEEYSLTAPALLGTTLLVRDRKRIMAIDLG